jgi:hypothetical protein
VLGSEHHAEHRQHSLERVICEREVLGVALDPIDLQSACASAAARRVEELRR